MSNISRLIIHCFDLEWGSAEVCDEWHRERGFDMIGYHHVINNGMRTSSLDYDIYYDGLIEPGRPLDFDVTLEKEEIGAHAYGFNGESIGIALVGKNYFTMNQFQSLLSVCHMWTKINPGLLIQGHYEINNKKTCPNFEMDTFRQVLDDYTFKQEVTLDKLKEFIT